VFSATAGSSYSTVSHTRPGITEIQGPDQAFAIEFNVFPAIIPGKPTTVTIPTQKFIIPLGDKVRSKRATEQKLDKYATWWANKTSTVVELFDGTQAGLLDACFSEAVYPRLMAVPNNQSARDRAVELANAASVRMKPPASAAKKTEGPEQGAKESTGTAAKEMTTLVNTVANSKEGVAAAAAAAMKTEPVAARSRETLGKANEPIAAYIAAARKAATVAVNAAMGMAMEATLEMEAAFAAAAAKAEMDEPDAAIR
jgi:hypothetical protein